MKSQKKNKLKPEIKTERSFFYHSFLCLVTSQVYILCAVFLPVFAGVFFIFFQGFFTPSASSSLYPLFSALSYAFTALIPLVCFKKTSSAYDDFVPLSELKKCVLDFLAIFAGFSILLLPLIFFPIFVNRFGAVDFGTFWTGFFALVLFSAAEISVCLFLVKCFSHSVVSLFASVLVLGCVNFCHLFAHSVPTSSVFSVLMRFFSFAWRFDSASRGLLDTGDLGFFVCAAAIFVFSAALSSEIKKGKVFEPSQKRRIFYVYLIFLLASLNLHVYSTKIDFSRDRQNSVSDFSKKLLRESNQTVKITYYRSKKLSSVYPAARNILNFLEAFAGQNKNINLVVKDCDKNEELRKQLLQKGIQPQKIRSDKSSSTELFDVYSSVVLEANGRESALPFVLSSQGLEYDLDFRLMQMIFNTQNRVNFLVGNGLSLYSDYDYLVLWLQNQGFECVEVTPRMLENVSGTLVVFGDSLLLENDAFLIEKYIARKNPVLICTSPIQADFKYDWKLSSLKNNYVLEMLEFWGVNFGDSVLADENCKSVTLVDDKNQALILNYPYWVTLPFQENAKFGLNLFWSVPLELLKNASPFLFTSEKSYKNPLDYEFPQNLAETNPFNLNERREKNLIPKEREKNIVGAVIKGDFDGYFTGEEIIGAEVYVISDELFASTLMNQYAGGESGDYTNYEFMANLLLKMNSNPELANLQSKSISDTSLYKITDAEKFNHERTFMTVFLLVILPVLVFAVLIFARFIWICGFKKSPKGDGQ